MTPRLERLGEDDSVARTWPSWIPGLNGSVGHACASWCRVGDMRDMAEEMMMAVDLERRISAPTADGHVPTEEDSSPWFAGPCSSPFHCSLYVYHPLSSTGPAECGGRE